VLWAFEKAVTAIFLPGKAPKRTFGQTTGLYWQPLQQDKNS
jgi:hypothetical protein